MRLWSVHPKYLDVRRLTAAWREGLLAQAVLLGNTKGYLSHSQLIRFKNTSDPINYIGSYLKGILDESVARGYNFNASKIIGTKLDLKLTVTDEQLIYESNHLAKKLNTLDVYKEVHPMFIIIKGPIESWERILT